MVQATVMGRLREKGRAVVGHDLKTSGPTYVGSNGVAAGEKKKMEMKWHKRRFIEGDCVRW